MARFQHRARSCALEKTPLSTASCVVRRAIPCRIQDRDLTRDEDIEYDLGGHASGLLFIVRLPVFPVLAFSFSQLSTDLEPGARSLDGNTLFIDKDILWITDRLQPTIPIARPNTQESL